MNNEITRHNQDAISHDCVIKGRKHANITGVKEVVSFDASGVVLITSCGELTLEGNDIKVGTLDTDRGIVAVDGEICAVYYYENKKGRKAFGGRNKN